MSLQTKKASSHQSHKSSLKGESHSNHDLGFRTMRDALCDKARGLDKAFLKRVGEIQFESDRNGKIETKRS